MSIPDTSRSDKLHLQFLSPLLPGLVLAGLVTGAAFGLHRLPGIALVSPIMIAMVLGLLFRGMFGLPEEARPGIAIVSKRLLRIAVALLGLQITWTEIAAIGPTGLSILAAGLASTFVVTLWLGRRMGIDAGLTQLIAAGTSVCGASAIFAANTVTRAEEQDVAYALACITLFGTLSMVLFPLTATLLGMNAWHYGLWTGAAIHEVAQVVGAAFQGGQEAGELGVVAKLARVVMLAPLIFCMAFMARRGVAGRASTDKVPLVPGFVLGFVALAVLNSVVTIPHEVRGLVGQAALIMLTLSLGAIGLLTSIQNIRSRGRKPLILSALGSLFIACISFVLIHIFT